MARAEVTVGLRLDLRPTIERLRATADALEQMQEQDSVSLVEAMRQIADDGQEGE
jgi:hypothetical protein